MENRVLIHLYDGIKGASKKQSTQIELTLAPYGSLFSTFQLLTFQLRGFW
jgi:hypothetical protein